MEVAKLTAPDIQPASEAFYDVAWWFVLLVMAYIPFFIGAHMKAKPKETWRHSLEAADTFFSVVYYAPLAYTACSASWALAWTLESRWVGFDTMADAFFKCYIAKSFMHIGLLYFSNTKGTLFLQMSAHHVLSIACYSTTILTRRMLFYGCFAAICEITNIFLTNLYVAKAVGYQGSAMDKMMPWLYQLNGFLLWLTFIIFRLIAFPVWMYLYYQDTSQHPYLRSELTTLPVELYLYPLTVLFLFCLSAFWMVPISKGLYKAICRKEVDKWSHKD